MFGSEHLVCEVKQLRRLPATIEHIISMEEHMTFLAFPELPGTVAIYGAG
ncbi:Wadjet anti-phage system protein JetD domain-containing protein [uncultured Corynebacterium sp.]|nr:Wadjet anti-phage system protein JetD domain-containing protein [uncultured Corynebacterium sp.]